MRQLANEHQGFIKLFNLVHTNVPMFRYNLKKSDLSPSKKKLLNIFMRYKQSNSSEYIKDLQSMSFDDPFFDSLRLLILGVFQNHYCRYRYAQENVHASYSYFKNKNFPDIIVYCQISLAVIYANQKQVQLMQMILDEIDESAIQIDYYQLCFVHAKSLLYLQQQDLEQAKKLLLKSLDSKNALLSRFEGSFLLQLIIISFKQKNEKEIFFLLEKYKKSKGMVVQSNYKYMKILLEFIFNQKALYVYAQDFEHFPELYNQLEVIKFLNSGDIKHANTHWKQLMSHNSQLYGQDFKYLGEYSIFSHALELSSFMATENDFSELSTITSPLDKLSYIFKHATVPIKKERLIELIWQEEYSEKSMGRLRKLISRYRKMTGHKVKSYQDSYSVVSEEDAA